MNGLPRRVRWIDVDPASSAARVSSRASSAWIAPAQGPGRIGAFGGSALGVALLLEELERPGAGAPPLVLAVGDGVRRGLPTAARATVLARAPLTGRLAEGHVGGDLGARLASITDALVVRGRARGPGAVLHIDASGEARLEHRPELVGASPAQAIAALGAAGAAVLTIGPAGERGIPFASLASGAPRASFVGRGGLGAVLAGLGLKALVIEAEPVRPSGEAQARPLLAALLGSPRLAARAEGGTLELYGALAASCDLSGRAASEPLPRAVAAGLLAESRAKRVERTGCAGCPTPCGWVFEAEPGLRQRAHFGATHALGANLGFSGLDDALALLARCDELGLDAKEAGGVLALESRAIEAGRLAGTPALGDRARLLARLDALVHGGPEAEALRGGTRALAWRLGLAGAVLDQGEAAPREGNLAALLGRSVSTGGADPMRSFPFLVGASSRERLARLCAAVGPLPAGAEDPHDPAGKGRLVAWHEDLVAAVDATGFCAFSTAGLLADGRVDLDGLARWILPEPGADADPAWRGLAPARRLLALGANLVLARRELDQRLAKIDGCATDPGVPDERLLLPGMLDEYRRYRGLDERGRLRAEVRARLGTPGVLAALGRAPQGGPPAAASALVPVAAGPGAAVLGRVELRMPDPVQLELALPARVLDVLAEAEAQRPALCGRLLQLGEPVPAVWRAGERLEASALVRAGDVLDLVTVIAGG